MIYRVVLDGNDILDYSDINLSLISPVLEIEINNAGSLEFVMPPYHKYYDMIRILTSTVEVYEDDILIWFGRPISEKIDFFKQKKVYCEGALSFFNDSVMRPLEIDGSSLHSFFRTLIDSHNGQVASDRTFIVGNITIDDGTVYRKLNYESTYDAIQNMCLSTNDGYLFIRKENGINYIDWLKDMPYECNQQIEFGINLLNYSSNFDASDFVTCVLPIGKTDSETDQPLTIASINGGSDIIVSEAAQTYGKVTKPLSLSDISDPYELMNEGQKYLENSQFNALIIECSAADLHSMNKTLDLFRVGQSVHCVSNPHLIDRDFPLSKMQINLDSAAKIITLGIIKRRTLTRIYKQESENTYQPDSYTPESYDPASIEDLNGDGWEVIMPDEDGGPVTAIRMPIKITIAKPPNKTNYTPGETIDFAGISVNIWTKNKDGQEDIWTNPPRYLDGKAPMSELSFSTKTAPNISEFSVMVTWTYKGKSYNTTLELHTVEASNWTANYIMMGTGTLGTVRNRTYIKTKAGKAIALMREETTGQHWAGPLIISDKRELTECKYGGTTTIASESDSAVINGIKFYLNHYGAYQGETVSSASVPVYHGSSDGGMEAWIRGILEFAHIQFN